MSNNNNYRLIRLQLSAGSRRSSIIHLSILLATATGAEIIAEYQSTPDQLKLAQMPFSAAIKYGAASPININPERMLQAIQQEIDCCRTELSQAASTKQINWSIRMVEEDKHPESNANREILAIPRDSFGTITIKSLQKISGALDDKYSVLIGAPDTDFQSAGMAQSKGVALIQMTRNSKPEILETAVNLASELNQPIYIFVNIVSNEDLQHFVTTVQVHLHNFERQNIFQTGFYSLQDLPPIINKMHPTITILDRNDIGPKQGQKLEDIMTKLKSPLLIVS
jgi:hypothetical protein